MVAKCLPSLRLYFAVITLGALAGSVSAQPSPVVLSKDPVADVIETKFSVACGRNRLTFSVKREGHRRLALTDFMLGGVSVRESDQAYELAKVIHVFQRVSIATATCPKPDIIMIALDGEKENSGGILERMHKVLYFSVIRRSVFVDGR
jgi:hypothetical protein